jgi:hypothetical protein
MTALTLIALILWLRRKGGRRKKYKPAGMGS